jgi:hypothetical protein
VVADAVAGVGKASCSARQGDDQMSGFSRSPTTSGATRRGFTGRPRDRKYITVRSPAQDVLLATTVKRTMSSVCEPVRSGGAADGDAEWRRAPRIAPGREGDGGADVTAAGIREQPFPEKRNPVSDHFNEPASPGHEPVARTIGKTTTASDNLSPRGDKLVAGLIGDVCCDDARASRASIRCSDCSRRRSICKPASTHAHAAAGAKQAEPAGVFGVAARRVAVGRESALSSAPVMPRWRGSRDPSGTTGTGGTGSGLLHVTILN